MSNKKIAALTSYSTAILVYYYVNNSPKNKDPQQDIIWYMRPLIHIDNNKDNENKDNYLSISQSRRLLDTFFYFHFVRRLFEVQFVQSSRGSDVPPFAIIGSCVNYALYGVLNKYDPKLRLNKTVATIGSLIFLIGEIGNLYHHYLLAQFRKEPKTEFNTSLNGKYILPHGALFEYLSMPHYFMELVSWFGYFVTNNFRIGSFILFVQCCITVIPLAIGRHDKNKVQFTQWPHNRKAILPFIL